MRPHNDISTVLANFPKSRNPLPPAYQRVYKEMYFCSREGGTLFARAALWLEQWMHREVARDRIFPLLEIGAGTLNHVPFEEPFGEYDVVEPQPFLYEGKNAAQRL